MKLLNYVLDDDKVKDIIVSEFCPSDFGLKNHPDCNYNCDKDLCEECWNRDMDEPYFPTGYEKD